MTIIYSLILSLLLLPSVSHAVGLLTPAGGDATYSVSEKAIESIVKTMVNGDIVFTVLGGPIQIVGLHSECITANDATASLMQWQSAPTIGTAATISGASLALTSATAGTTVHLDAATLATALPIVTAANGGVYDLTASGNQIVVKAGTIKLVITVGSTTGTWKHYLRYKPLSPSSTVQ